MSNNGTLKLRLAGPIKRSTFQQSGVDPIGEALTDLLHWSWSTRLQIDRFVRSLRNEPKVWNASARLAQRRGFSATSFDEHMLMVAAGNLHQAVARMPRSLRRQVEIDDFSLRLLSTLRDIYEHWYQLRRYYRHGSKKEGHAALKLKANFPHAEPWSFTIDPKNRDVFLAGVVALGPFVKQLCRLERTLLRVERTRKSTRHNHSVPSAPITS